MFKAADNLDVIGKSYNEYRYPQSRSEVAGAQLLANWKWKFAHPEEGGVLPCHAGIYCAFPKKKREPGNSYGYWIQGGVQLRTCSQKCAEIFIQKYEDGALLFSDPKNLTSQRKNFSSMR